MMATLWSGLLMTLTPSRANRLAAPGHSGAARAASPHRCATPAAASRPGPPRAAGRPAANSPSARHSPGWSGGRHRRSRCPAAASSPERAVSRARTSSTAAADVPSGTRVVMVTRYSIARASACVTEWCGMAGCPDYRSVCTTLQALPGRQALWTSARSGATVVRTSSAGGGPARAACTSGRGAEAVDMSEVVVLPVADVDRAKVLDKALGWREDAQFAAGPDFRLVQLTPPGWPASLSSAPASVGSNTRNLTKQKKKKKNRVAAARQGPSTASATATSDVTTEVYGDPVMNLMRRWRRRWLGSSSISVLPERLRGMPGFFRVVSGGTSLTMVGSILNWARLIEGTPDRLLEERRDSGSSLTHSISHQV